LCAWMEHKARRQKNGNLLLIFDNNHLEAWLSWNVKISKLSINFSLLLFCLTLALILSLGKQIFSIKSFNTACFEEIFYSLLKLFLLYIHFPWKCDKEENFVNENNINLPPRRQTQCYKSKFTKSFHFNLILNFPSSIH
jgi:hypothetical protein